MGLVGICGLEPQTSSLSVTRSNQLSYIPDLFYFSVFGGKLQGLDGDFGGRGGAGGGVRLEGGKAGEWEQSKSPLFWG